MLSDIVGDVYVFSTIDQEPIPFPPQTYYLTNIFYFNLGLMSLESYSNPKLCCLAYNYDCTVNEASGID